MNNEKQNQGGQNDSQKTQGTGKTPLPDRDTLRGFITRDLEAALYFLGYLRESPTVIDKLLDMMESDSKIGARIDAIEANKTQEHDNG